MTTPITFPIAKLLKEKGFDNNRCIKKYIGHHLEELNGNRINSIISAPTIAEVVMWLYDKHGIWIQVTVNTIWVGRKKEPEAKYNSEVVSQNRNLKVRSLITRKVRIEPYDSPTEAYESAIEYTLNNLI